MEAVSVVDKTMPLSLIQKPVDSDITPSSLKLSLLGFQYNTLGFASTSLDFLSIVIFPYIPDCFTIGVPQGLVLGPLIFLYSLPQTFLLLSWL